MFQWYYRYTIARLLVILTNHYVMLWIGGYVQVQKFLTNQCESWGSDFGMLLIVCSAESTVEVGIPP